MYTNMLKMILFTIYLIQTVIIKCAAHHVLKFTSKPVDKHMHSLFVQIIEIICKQFSTTHAISSWKAFDEINMFTFVPASSAAHTLHCFCLHTHTHTLLYSIYNPNSIHTLIHKFEPLCWWWTNFIYNTFIQRGASAYYYALENIVRH